MVIVGVVGVRVDRDRYGFIVAMVSPAMVMVFSAMISVCPAGID
jgi:hypothetical protein